jgi:hypothetical protein
VKFQEFDRTTFGKDDLVQVGQTITIETEAIVAKRNTSNCCSSRIGCRD